MVLLFSRIERSGGGEFGDDLLRRAVDALLLDAVCGDALLFLAVVQNQRHVLPLHARRQPVLVVVPEQPQQLIVRDLRGVEIDAHNFRVIATESDARFEFVNK